jgi:hypothetical protein
MSSSSIYPKSTDEVKVPPTSPFNKHILSFPLIEIEKLLVERDVLEDTTKYIPC